MVSSVFSRPVIALKHILGVVCLQEDLDHEDDNMTVPGEERASSFYHSLLIYLDKHLQHLHPSVAQPLTETVNNSTSSFLPWKSISSGEDTPK